MMKKRDSNRGNFDIIKKCYGIVFGLGVLSVYCK